MLAIQNFQQRLYARYKNGLSLPPTYNYIYGNPVQTFVPVQTTQHGVCVIGAYPPARMRIVGSESDVPVADDCIPFSPDIYFDGNRVQTTAVDLTKNYLSPLNLSREQCWLTYLVRVFLFKDEHLAKYRRLGCMYPERETRSQFDSLARRGMKWLEEELILARPKLVITVGAEVAGVLQDIRGIRASQALLGGQMQDLWLGETVYPVIHLAELGSTGDDERLSRLHWMEHLPMARGIVEQLVA